MASYDVLSVLLLFRALRLGPRGEVELRGRAVQVDPLKPTFSERLKLKCDDSLSNYAFSFNMRRCNVGILLIFFSVFFILAFLALSYINYSRR